MSPFNIATPEQIKTGETTDIYFVRTKQILKAKGKDRTRVVAEATTGGIPGGYPWGILCGTDEVMPPDVPRICLVDTYFDEKVEAVMAADALGERLQAVRLDTPGSRRGDMAEIIREVRWELDLRGHGHVRIFVSGGLDEETVKRYGEAGADVFGVGTWVSGAPTVDFGFDIVEVEGRPAAKRGKLGGRKQVWRCPRCLVDLVQPFKRPSPKCPSCGDETDPMLVPLIMNGKVVADIPNPRELRERVLDQIGRLTTQIT